MRLHAFQYASQCAVCQQLTDSSRNELAGETRQRTVESRSFPKVSSATEALFPRRGLRIPSVPFSDALALCRFYRSSTHRLPHRRGERLDTADPPAPRRERRIAGYFDNLVAHVGTVPIG